VTYQPRSEPESRDWDAIVVGAGPAGATAARELAALGHAVLLIDKSEFPRDKVCGDGLIPDALRSLERAGLIDEVADRGHHLSVLSAFSPSNVRVDLPGDFLTIRRRTLDHLVQQSAVTRGATFHVARVIGLEESGDQVRVRLGQGAELRSQVVILATGADVGLLGGLGRRPSSGPSAVALRCYVRSEYALDELIIAFPRWMLPGYAWIFPLGGGEYNIGCGLFYRRGRPGGGNLRQTFQAFTERFPIARDLMARASDVTTPRGARLRCGPDAQYARPAARVLSIGETVGTTFPFTGEGIGKAMETGEMAAQQADRALRERDLAPLEAFPSRIERELAPRYAGYRQAERWAARPWLVDLVARRVRKNPRLHRAAAGMLNETIDPKRVFSWRLFLPRWIPVRP
jgi:geranylgeranyl reductase family protein